MIMKTENNLTNKAMFFAQYCNVNVLYVGGVGLQPVGEKGWNLKHPDFFLELTPLSSITDDDAFEVAKIVSPSLFMSSGDDSKHYIDRSESHWLSVKHPRKLISVDIDYDGYCFEYHEETEYTRPYSTVAGSDYLRSKGYAIGWRDLSVDVLVKYGWIKLKK